MKTVREITFDLLKRLELNIIVGNPGSTEETFLKNFPEDFTYILALQEASVIGIADGIAQGLKKPVLVNLHTGAGVGNAMGNIITAYINKTPLIITAGQQTREMLFIEPFLTNVDATVLPKPWMKWSYEPTRAQDIPAAFMRAYLMATQQPAGPVFLSLPLDDWDHEMIPEDYLRLSSKVNAPDPLVMTSFIEKINQSQNPVLVYGADVARNNAWDIGLAFAEKLQAKVWNAPFIERNVFPESHALFQGTLPAAIGPLSEKLQGHDLIIVIGAPVFRYYPWVRGQYLPENAKLLQITDSAYEAAKAAVGDSLVADTKLTLESMLPQIKPRNLNITNDIYATQSSTQQLEDNLLTAQQVFESLTGYLPKKYILVQESPSNVWELRQSSLGKLNKPDSYFAMSSGGLGWGLPAAIGLAFAEQTADKPRPVIAIMGDGSFNYSPQAIWTGVQHRLPIIIIVLKNEQYAILKSFALLEDTPKVPGLDLPSLDCGTVAQGYGAEVFRVKTPTELQASFARAIKNNMLTVIEIPIVKKILPLLR